MTSRSLRTAGVLALLLATSALTVPAGASAPDPAPQSTCADAFCATFDLATNDAFAPTQPTTSAAQPSNLALRFTDTSPTVGTDESQWLAKVSAVLGTSPEKGFSVTAPAQLPLGSYVAGSSATAGSCAPGTDGTAYAATCPAGSGSGLVALAPLVPGPEEIRPAVFGIRSMTVVPGGKINVDVSVWINGLTLPMLTPITTTITMIFAKATASAGPSFAMGTQPAIPSPNPLLYSGADFSMNTVAINLNGLVTEGPAGAVNPPVAFVRQSPTCTAITSTLVAQARSATVAASQFTTNVTGCPAAPATVSIVPVAGQPHAFAFTMKVPTPEVAGRTASLEWVFGDGAKAVTGATTSHTYPVAEPVTAIVTTIDSAGARSTPIPIEISTGALKAKQESGTRLVGTLTDQQTDDGLADQDVLAFKCASRKTPLAQCDAVGTTVTKAGGKFALKIPAVKKPGEILISHAGTATHKASKPARFPTFKWVRVLPQPTVTFKVSDKSVSKGAVVSLSGTVTPNKLGKKLQLQQFYRGKWRAISKATISDRGTYRAPFKVRRTGTIKVRAVVPQTDHTLISISRTQRIMVS
jgi:hypothetical protein